MYFNARSLLFLVVYAAAAATKSDDLFEAVAANSQTKLKLALQNGADINSIMEGSGQTPLMNAVLSGKVQAVKYLLRKGADVTIPEKDGYTPMHGAGFQGRSEIAKLLIKHGVPINDEHIDGYNPIHRACWGREERHTDTVRVFLEGGAKLRGDELRATQNDRTKQLLIEWQERQQAIDGVVQSDDL